MKVFLSVASFHPSYGGPARSVSRLANALAASGVELGLWAPDQSAADTSFLADDARIVRLKGSADEALEQFGKADLIHDNGIWLPHNHRLARLAWKMGIPRVVSTRGMLEPWALCHKRWKKRLAWTLYQKRDLCAAAALHATAASEAQQIRGLALGCPVHILANGVDLPTISGAGPSGDEGLTALFLGRIHPVKGLPMLVEAWDKVRPVGWRMRVVGPDEGGHLAAVRERVRRLGLADEWTFDGPLEGDAKREAFQSASLFVLPTHSENFGMAIAESLAHGVPVITTHGAPWSMLETRGCGWWVPANVEGIAAALVQATRLGPQELRTMGQRGRLQMRQDFSWTSIADGILRMYESVAS